MAGIIGLIILFICFGLAVYNDLKNPGTSEQSRNKLRDIE